MFTKVKKVIAWSALEIREMTQYQAKYFWEKKNQTKYRSKKK